MEEILRTFNLSDDDEIFMGYTNMIELYNALKYSKLCCFYLKDVKV